MHWDDCFHGTRSERSLLLGLLRVAFPPGATSTEKMQLLGTTLFLDFGYFEQDK